MKRTAKNNSNDIRPEDRFLGQRLKAAREAAGLTQGELAAKLHWFDGSGEPSQRLVSHYETGRRSISGIDLIAYSNAINTDIKDILAIRLPAARQKG